MTLGSGKSFFIYLNWTYPLLLKSCDVAIADFLQTVGMVWVILMARLFYLWRCFIFILYVTMRWGYLSSYFLIISVILKLVLLINVYGLREITELVFHWVVIGTINLATDIIKYPNYSIASYTTYLMFSSLADQNHLFTSFHLFFGNIFLVLLMLRRSIPRTWLVLALFTLMDV